MIIKIFHKFTLLRGVPYLYNILIIYYIFFYSNHNEQQFYNNLAAISIVLSIISEGLINEFSTFRKLLHKFYQKYYILLALILFYLLTLIKVSLFSAIPILFFLCIGNAIFLRINILAESKLIYLSSIGRILILFLIFILIKSDSTSSYSLIAYISVTLPILINTLLLYNETGYVDFGKLNEEAYSNKIIFAIYLLVNIINGLFFPNLNTADLNLLQSRINSLVINNCYSFFRINTKYITNLFIIILLISNILMIFLYSEFNILFISSTFCSLIFISFLRAHKIN